jgi:single-stranded-DNA-specific exonuclease
MNENARWVLNPADSAVVSALAHELACPPAIAALLCSRGLSDPGVARHFFNPSLDDLHDPNLMLGMVAAVDRIRAAVTAGEPILIYGDYDVDGTTATVLLKTAIERIAPPHQPAQVSYHVPHRLREGYGIQNSRLAEAATAGVRLVISVDTGIRAFDAAREARLLGLDLIVTDHHLPDGIEGLPDALVVINPAQPGCPYPYKHLCGAGVAFKLAHALLLSAASTEAARVRLRTVLLPSFLKLVAIATIADSVALTGENRAMVWLGLRALANPVQPGLRALMEVAKLPLDRPPSAMEVGFRIGPRINAAGRMDVASDVVELFLTRDPERACQLAQRLDTLNTDRRASEAAALEAIELQLGSLLDANGSYPACCIVLDHPEWHRGVLGILASRVVERTGRPALVLTSADGEAHGSGRSVAGYHLLDAISAAERQIPGAPLFHRFGGHAFAVGFSLPAASINVLRERIQLHSGALLTADLLTPEHICEADLSASDLSADLLLWLARCAPFGMDNPEPLFCVHNLTVAGPPRIIQQKNICLPLGNIPDGRPLSATGWSRSGRTTWAERAETLALTSGSGVDLVGRLRENLHPLYGGIEFDLVDLRLTLKQ